MSETIAARCPGLFEHASVQRLLDESLAEFPAESHLGMLTNLRVNREIMAAWRAEFGDDDEPDGTETETRISTAE